MSDPVSASLWRLNAETLAQRVRQGELSAVEVFGSCLERIAEVEPRIQAFLTVLEQEGLQRAKEIDQRRAVGEKLGPLAGVPIAIKDNISCEGQPLTCGSTILQGYSATYSATAVERLQQADAVLIGKSNLDEFAMGSSCENSAFQMTRNPWNLSRVPGGSSGGSAAAVAAALPLALGSDTGGSIRQPAAFSGIVGLKPTYGRVSRYGLVAFASSTDQIGPLSRTVRDAALCLAVIAGRDHRDSTTTDEPLGGPLASIEAGIEGMRIGVIEEIETANLAQDVRNIWRAALRHLESLGAELVELSIPHLRAAIACYYVIASSEASANLARFDGVRYGRRSSGSATLVDLYRQSRGQGFGAEVKRRIMLGTYALSAGHHDAYYGRAQGVRERLRQQFNTAFEQVDVLVTPTAPSGAFAIGERTGDPLSMYLSDIYTTPASLVGLPAISVPCGHDEDGLPLGLQIQGQLFDETAVLRAARAFEKAMDWKVEPGFAEKTA